jgi:hypothetical protein
LLSYFFAPAAAFFAIAVQSRAAASSWVAFFGALSLDIHGRTFALFGFGHVRTLFDITRCCAGCGFGNNTSFAVARRASILSHSFIALSSESSYCSLNYFAKTHYRLLEDLFIACTLRDAGLTLFVLRDLRAIFLPRRALVSFILFFFFTSGVA